jgi:uncharacterized protein
MKDLAAAQSGLRDSCVKGPGTVVSGFLQFTALITVSRSDIATGFTVLFLLMLSALAFVPTAAAQRYETRFESGGVELDAFLYRNSDTGPHALAVNLSGNPGGPLDRPSATVDALVAAGVDVFRFNYRGLWGNRGDFNLTNAIGDLRAALDYLTDPETVARFGHDPSTIILVGYSFGTAVALVGASSDERVDGIVSLAPCDHGYFGGEFANPRSKIREFLDAVTESLFGAGGPVEGGEEAFVHDLIKSSDAYGFVPQAEGLLDKKLLFLGGLDDTVCYTEDHLFPLYRRLRVLDHPALEARVLGMDHGAQGIGFDSLMQITTGWVEASFPALPESRRPAHE